MKRTEGVREGQPRVNEKSNTYEPKERETAMTSKRFGKLRIDKHG